MKYIFTILFLIFSNCFAVEFGDNLDTIPKFKFIQMDTSTQSKVYIFEDELYPDTSIYSCLYYTRNDKYYQFSVMGTGINMFNSFARVLESQPVTKFINLQSDNGDTVYAWEDYFFIYSLQYYSDKNFFTFKKLTKF